MSKWDFFIKMKLWADGKSSGNAFNQHFSTAVSPKQLLLKSRTLSLRVNVCLHDTQSYTTLHISIWGRRDVHWDPDTQTHSRHKHSSEQNCISLCIINYVQYNSDAWLVKHHKTLRRTSNNVQINQTEHLTPARFPSTRIFIVN